LRAIHEEAQREATAREAKRVQDMRQQTAQQSQAAAAALAVQVCADARVQRMTLDLQVPVYRRGPGGERVFMADADRPAAKKNLDETIATYCSDEPTAAAAQRQRFLELSLGRRPACIELRGALDDLEAKPARDSAEEIQRLTERLSEGGFAFANIEPATDVVADDDGQRSPRVEIGGARSGRCEGEAGDTCASHEDQFPLQHLSLQAMPGRYDCRRRAALPSLCRAKRVR
jgi:hypothetical protein